MGFRFQRRVKIAPGITLNLSKTGVSASLGPRGAKLTIGRRNPRVTLGAPGTGISQSFSAKADDPTTETQRSALPNLLIVIAVLIFFVWLFS